MEFSLRLSSRNSFASFACACVANLLFTKPYFEKPLNLANCVWCTFYYSSQWNYIIIALFCSRFAPHFIEQRERRVCMEKNNCIEIRAVSEKKLLRGTGNITFNLKSGSGTGTICSHSRHSSFLSTHFFFYSRANAKQLCMAKELNCAGKYNNVDISKMFDSTLKIEWGIRVNCSEERPAQTERSRTQMKR